MEISKAISLSRKTANITREYISFSWGDFEYCKKLFTHLFVEVDKSVSSFVYHPKYDEIVEWMTNTRGRGLFLYGDCGQGKSTINAYMVPVLFAMHGFVVKSIHAEEMEAMIKTSNVSQVSGLDYLLKSRFPIIDELGLETKITNYGEPFEAFLRIVNCAEPSLKPLFVTTNLSLEQVFDRYGERTIDRISRLCKIVELKGKSMR